MTYDIKNTHIERQAHADTSLISPILVLNAGWIKSQISSIEVLIISQTINKHKKINVLSLKNFLVKILFIIK
mgnify:CR=1 FL=1